jgi:hypothetical protein
MLRIFMTMLVFSCLALFGLRGALPDVLNNYSPTTVFLFALVIIPAVGTAVYEITERILRNHHFHIHIRHKHV